MFHVRPSSIIDPESKYGYSFALDFDNFCVNLALKMIEDGKLV